MGRYFHRRYPGWVHKLYDEIRSMKCLLIIISFSMAVSRMPSSTTNQARGGYIGAELQRQLDLRWRRHFNQCSDQRHVDVVHGLRPQAGKLGNRSDDFGQFFLLFLSEVRRAKQSDRRSEISERLCNGVGDRFECRCEMQ